MVEPLPNGASGKPEQLAEFDDLLDGALAHPRIDPLADPVAVVPSPDLESQLRDLGELRAVHHRGEVQPLLAGHHADTDVTVLGRLDRRHLDRARDRRPRKQLRMQPFAALHQGDRLEHGHVQVAARSAARDPTPQRHRTVGRPCPTHVLAQLTTDRDRGARGISAKTGQPGRGLKGELGRGTLRPRTGPAEIGDGHHDALRPGLDQPCRVNALFGGGGSVAGDDHDVGPGQQLIGNGCHASLPGGQVAEQRRIGAICEFAAGGGEAAQRITREGLDLHHVGTRVDQQLAAITARDTVAHLDDAQIIERSGCRVAHAHNLPGPVSCHLSNFCRIAIP